MEEVKRQAYNQIAKVKFALDGTSTYPDATFTLRLSYGIVKGYEENGAKVPAFTTYEGLYKRSAEQKNKPPFDLPPLWEKKKAALDLSTPYNFVCTADIIGGNSGSPTINKAGERINMLKGEKSPTGSYGKDLKRAALTASVELLPTKTV